MNQAGTTITGKNLERHELEERLLQLQTKIRCVHRAVYLMTFLTACALAGLCYATVFLPDFPQTLAQFLMQFAVRACCALALASLLCLLAFLALEGLYRRELARRRETQRLYILG